MFGFSNSAPPTESFMGNSNVQQLLSEGIAAAKTVQNRYASQSSPSAKGLPTTGDLQAEHARQLLLRVTELDETNVSAWLWLSAIVENVEDKYTCLNNVLILDPTNQLAKTGLALLDKQTSKPNPSAKLVSTSPQKTSEQQSGIAAQTHRPSICPFCNLATDVEDTVCPHCTLPLVISCPACTTPTNVEWQHCANCDFEIGDPQFGAIYFTQLATAYKNYRRFIEAVDALHFAEMIMPDLPDLHRFLGEIQVELGQVDKAILTLKKAIEMESDQAGPYLMLGKVLRKVERYEEAEQLYRKAIKAVPESSETYFAMGDLLMQRHRFKHAWGYLQKTIHLDPDHGPAWVRVGQIYESQQKPSSAIRAYKRAVAVLDPDSPARQAVLERINTLQA